MIQFTKTTNLKFRCFINRNTICVPPALLNSDLFWISDVIGVCKSVDEVTRLTTKNNREVSKRTINMIDMSGKMVTLTLWGEEVSRVMRI